MSQNHEPTSGVPICMPDDNYPLYEPLCGPPASEDPSWLGLDRRDLPRLLVLRQFVIEERP